MASNGEHNLSGQELPLSIMRLYLPRTGRFDSVVAKPKIEIIFFNGQRARLKSGLTKVSPMSPGRTFEFWWTRWDSAHPVRSPNRCAGIKRIFFYLT